MDNHNESGQMREAINLAIALLKIPSDLLTPDEQFYKASGYALLGSLLPENLQEFVHEAGHAVVAAALDHEVLGVAVEPGIGGEARIRYSHEVEDLLLDRITVAVASFAAEFLIFGVGRPSSVDWDRVNQDAFDQGRRQDRRTDCVELLNSQIPRADTILRSNMLVLESLSVALADRRRLEGEALHEILADVVREQPA